MYSRLAEKLNEANGYEKKSEAFDKESYQLNWEKNIFTSLKNVALNTKLRELREFQ